MLVPPITPSAYANLAIGAALEIMWSNCCHIRGQIVRTNNFKSMVLHLTFFFVHSCGNKRPLASYFVVGAIFALLANMIPGSNMNERKAKAAMLVLGRIAIAMCASVNFVYVQELFPTIIRNSAFGLCSIAMRIGDILGSYLVLLVSCCPVHRSLGIFCKLTWIVFANAR